MKANSKSKNGNKSNGNGFRGKNITAEDERFLKQHSDQLSKSTLRAKWIHSADEHEDYKGQTLATRSHEVIRHWAEERKAEPSTVPSKHDGEVRVLRFDFPNFGGKRLKHIDWEKWFKPFDERELVFLYQEHMKSGNQSNFFRLDNPRREEA
jgi:hypothetical protein